MPSKAYKIFLERNEIVDRLLEAYDLVKQAKNPLKKPGRMALDHVTRAAVVFIVTAAEVYIENLLLESANEHIKDAHNFDKLPEPIRETLKKTDNAYVGEKWIQKYRRLVRNGANNFNSPWNETVKLYFTNYLAVSPTLVESLPRFIEFKRLIELRGDIVHKGNGKKYIKKEDVVIYQMQAKEFIGEMDNYMLSFFKINYAKCSWYRVALKDGAPA